MCFQTPQKTSSNLQQFPDIRVLVAEDNHVNQMVIKGLLNKFGINPTITENGRWKSSIYSKATKCTTIEIISATTQFDWNDRRTTSSVNSKTIGLLKPPWRTWNGLRTMNIWIMEKMYKKTYNLLLFFCFFCLLSLLYFLQARRVFQNLRRREKSSSLTL